MERLDRPVGVCQPRDGGGQAGAVSRPVPCCRRLAGRPARTRAARHGWWRSRCARDAAAQRSRRTLVQRQRGPTSRRGAGEPRWLWLHPARPGRGSADGPRSGGRRPGLQRPPGSTPSARGWRWRAGRAATSMGWLWLSHAWSRTRRSARPRSASQARCERCQMSPRPFPSSPNWPDQVDDAFGPAWR
jgi:hypothetical protein